tara:strand:- start:1681 stop:2325 length:645 start_codon:yes stop_codon:yes gene_type:complete
MSKEKSMSLAEKLFNIKKEVGFLKPDKDGHNYKYASPNAVLGAFNPLFEKYNILFTFSITDTKATGFAKQVGSDMDGKALMKHQYEILHHVILLMTFEDVETGEIRKVPWAGTGANATEQGFGSALTYGERYFLLKYFGIPVNEDDPNHLRTVQANKKDISLPEMTSKVHDSLLKGIDAKNFTLVEKYLLKYKDGTTHKVAVENALATAQKKAK